MTEVAPIVSAPDPIPETSASGISNFLHDMQQAQQKVQQQQEEISIMPAATAAAIEANKPKMVPMLLERNYVPKSEHYEIVGYNREPKTVKSAAGVMVTVDPGGFIQERDEDTGKIMGMPPTLAGTGFANKLIAGTVVKLPVDEAKRVRDLKIGSRTLDD